MIPVTFRTYKVRVVAGICLVLVRAPAGGLSCTTTAPLLVREPAERARRCEDAALVPARRWLEASVYELRRRCPKDRMPRLRSSGYCLASLLVSVVGRDEQPLCARVSTKSMHKSLTPAMPLVLVRPRLLLLWVLVCVPYVCAILAQMCGSCRRESQNLSPGGENRCTSLHVLAHS